MQCMVKRSQKLLMLATAAMWHTAMTLREQFVKCAVVATSVAVGARGFEGLHRPFARLAVR